MRHDDPRRPQLVALLVAGERPGKIAVRFDVDSDTVRAWRNDPGVVAEVERARNEIVGEALGKMKALAGEIPAALSEALDIARKSKDPYAIKAIVETIADRVGLPKTTKLEQTVEVTPSSVEDMTAQLAALAASPQGEQGG